MSHPDPWDDYRRRRRLWWYSVLGFVPVMAGAVLVAPSARARWTVPAIALGWVACYVIASVRLGVFPCPRCRKAFAGAWWAHNPFVGRCVRCGLSKWEIPAGAG
jgi:hypothetical protein